MTKAAARGALPRTTSLQCTAVFNAVQCSLEERALRESGVSHLQPFKLLRCLIQHILHIFVLDVNKSNQKQFEI